MAVKQKKVERIVTCESCRHSETDTTGPSFSVITGKYFMCRCKAGVNAPYKLFLQTKRTCSLWQPRG